MGGKRWHTQDEGEQKMPCISGFLGDDVMVIHGAVDNHDTTKGGG